MYHKNSFTVFCLIICFGILTSCSETTYMAHVAKQIPLPGDTPKSVGYYKVGTPYKIKNRQYYPAETFSHTETGIASWYGPNFHGKLTANGEIFNKNDLTAAHRTLQLPSIIRVTNLRNGRSIILRVNDRGPFAHDRVLDVSERAASLLGFKNQGTTKVRIDVLPYESRKVAEAAKAGKNTSGYEIALNQNKVPSRSNVQQQRIASPVTPNRKPEPVTQVVLSNNTAPTPIPRPAPVERQVISHPVDYNAQPPIPQSLEGRIYVQTGAFSDEQNAARYSQQINNIAPSNVYRTVRNDTPLYRVRLGPFESRMAANATIEQLDQNGINKAVIVID